MIYERHQQKMTPSDSPTTYHLLNPGNDLVTDALNGLAQAHPSLLVYHPSSKILHRSDLQDFRSGKVTTIASAGAGHEPMFAGYVGPNGLSAFVSGAVFAAPTGAQMLAALRLCKSPRGTLLLMGNYTGDVLNAGMAITRARAEGLKVRLLVVGDDVAVGRSKGGSVGRRGLCGHLLCLKVACALAEQGKSFEEVVAAAEWIAARIGTISTAFDRCALPTAICTPLDLLPPDTVELGMGAHGEPGLLRISPVPHPRDLVQKMVKLLVDRMDPERGFVDLESDDKVILLVNSLGSTSNEILAKFADLALLELEREGFRVERVLWGPLVTSLRMSGVGLTIGRLPRPSEPEVAISHERILECWDLPMGAVAWPGSAPFST